jgi:hypothetical protein
MLNLFPALPSSVAVDSALPVAAPEYCSATLNGLNAYSPATVVCVPSAEFVSASE